MVVNRRRLHRSEKFLLFIFTFQTFQNTTTDREERRRRREKLLLEDGRVINKKAINKGVDHFNDSAVKSSIE